MKRLIITLGLVLSSACSGGLADLRPEMMQASSPDSAAIERGRTLLQRMYDAHGGLERWEQFNFVHAKASDEWFNSLFWALASPYEENPEHVFVASYTQQFPHARLEFPGGDNAGHTWVVKGNRLTTKEPSAPSEAEALRAAALKATFIRNFLLWPNVPFQLATADHAIYVGEGKWDGKNFDRVLISWGSLEPNTETDQWELWINKDTQLLERVRFTIRMFDESAVAGYNLKEFKTIQGLTIATVYEGLADPDDEDPLHTYTFSDIEFSRRQDADLMRVAP